jgi:hypothetical protein
MNTSRIALQDTATVAAVIPMNTLSLHPDTA